MVRTTRVTQPIEVQPLTRAGFSPYGDVIETVGAQHFDINGGRAMRYDDLASVDTLEFSGLPAISIFRSAAMQLPIELRVMERHLLGSQAIVPIDGVACLVAVAPAGDFDPALIQVFLATGKQGVNYRRGTWHHPLISLDRTGDFLVLDRKGPGENCDVIWLNPSIRIADFLSPGSTL